MPDNLNPVDSGNSNPADSGIVETGSTGADTSTSTATLTPDPSITSKGWKQGLSTDLRNSPLLQKFDDTQDGLAKAFESHTNLEKLLGHEKVPLPKGPNDVEGHARLAKALGVPDRAEGYGLADPKLPKGLEGIAMDKSKFAEIAHAHKLTPAQAKSLWETYTQMNVSAYNKAMDDHQKNLTETVNRLRGEWGDAYDTNVELGQMVINNFAGDQETNDWLTAVFSQDPRGVKFLAKIGEQFAENKVGEFSYKKFSKTPEELQEEVEKETRDLEGPYMNTKNKFTAKEHQAAVDRINFLREQIMKFKR